MATAPTKLVAKNETTKKLTRSTGSESMAAQSGAMMPMASAMPAAMLATMRAKKMTMMRPSSDMCIPCQ